MSVGDDGVSDSQYGPIYFKLQVLFYTLTKALGQRFEVFSFLYQNLLYLTSLAQTVKASAYNVGDPGSIPGLGRSPGEGNGNPLQYSCLENPMDRGAWWATVHGVAKSQT